MTDEQPHEERDRGRDVHRGVVDVRDPCQPVVVQHEVLEAELRREAQRPLQVVDLAGPVDRSLGRRQRQLAGQPPDRVQRGDDRQLLRRRTDHRRRPCHPRVRAPIAGADTSEQPPHDDADRGEDRPVVPGGPFHARTVCLYPEIMSVTAPTTLPAANEACWCGSGRKYKRCHKKSEGRILPGFVTPMRSVPASIGRPPYADTGDVRALGRTAHQVARDHREDARRRRRGRRGAALWPARWSPPASRPRPSTSTCTTSSSSAAPTRRRSTTTASRRRAARRSTR